MTEAVSPQRFDALIAASLPRHLWGAKAIATAAGVSPETVRRSWADDPECPVRKVGGRLYATRTELATWLAGYL